MVSEKTAGATVTFELLLHPLTPSPASNDCTISNERPSKRVRAKTAPPPLSCGCGHKHAFVLHQLLVVHALLRGRAPAAALTNCSVPQCSQAARYALPHLDLQRRRPPLLLSASTASVGTQRRPHKQCVC